MHKAAFGSAPEGSTLMLRAPVPAGKRLVVEKRSAESIGPGAVLYFVRAVFVLGTNTIAFGTGRLQTVFR